MNQNPPNLVDHVSVRECFLYLQSRIRTGDWKARNDTPNWTVSTRRGLVHPEKYNSNDDPNTQPGGSVPPVPKLRQQPPSQQNPPRNPQSARNNKKYNNSGRATPSSGDQRGRKGKPSPWVPSRDVQHNPKRRVDPSRERGQGNRSLEPSHPGPPARQLQPRPGSSKDNHRGEHHGTRRPSDAPPTQPNLPSSTSQQKGTLDPNDKPGRDRTRTIGEPGQSQKPGNSRDPELRPVPQGPPGQQRMQRAS